MIKHAIHFIVNLFLWIQNAIHIIVNLIQHVNYDIFTDYNMVARAIQGFFFQERIASLTALKLYGPHSATKPCMARATML